MKYKKRANKGFTLLEILLVIAAIGILAAIVLVAINPNRQIAQARNTVRQADINTIQKAVEQYLIEKGSYPSSITTTPGYICNTGTEQVNGSTNCSGRIDLRELVPDYIAGIPKDPQATGTSTGYNIVINPNNNKIAISSDLAESKLISLNPYIVTNGLVLNLDAGNPSSYPGTGNTWFDLSGNGNNGTLVNGVGYNNGNGGSLVFDGVNDYVTISNSSSLNPPANTLICWARSNTENWNEYGFLMSKRDVFVMHPEINVKTVRFYYRLNNTWQSELVNPQNITIWNMYAYSWDGTKISAYLNGNLISSGVKNGSLNTVDTGVLEIGRDDGNIGRVMNGNIAQVSIYNRALTPEEIQQNFNASRGRFGL
jgi:prepilin-type N-terminal cleavage/methylation domain-containing protein